MATTAPFSPEPCLLAGPGPSSIDPRVLAAMQQPLISHVDLRFRDEMLALAEMLGEVYGCREGSAISLSCTGTAGMEAGILNLVAPGDTVVAANAGFFGTRIVDMLHRRGAQVVELTAEPGTCVPNDAVLDALERHPEAVMVCVVHAETSTGVRHPVEELGAELRRRGSDALLFVDCVTSLGGIPVGVDEWGIDYAYSCSQKCLAAPPGLSPIAISARAQERLGRDGMPVPYVLDLREILRLWLERPLAYHHTMPNLQLYALDEAVRLVLEEGLEARFARHADAGAYLQAALRERGLELVADPALQLPQLTAIHVPDGVDALEVRARMLRDHAIEIGGGLAGLPPMWRIGLMGVNATREVADRVLAAFDDALAG